MEQPRLKVEQIKTEALVPYANNAKLHNAKQVQQIASSIQQFGFNDPVAVWQNPAGELEIVEGHGRVLAAKELGMSVLPVIRLDHLDDDGRRAYTHVHNQLTLESGFDWSIIDREISELSAFDWEEFGFQPAEAFNAIEDLMTDEFAAPRGEGDTFYFSVTFDKQYEDVVKRYLKEYGRENIEADILKEAQEWE